MLTNFAASDPQTVLSSGNTLAILALIIVTLAGVIAILTRYFVKKLDSKDVEIKGLNSQLLAQSQSHTADYKEMAKDNQEVLLSNSQNMALFGAKIEIVKGKR